MQDKDIQLGQKVQDKISGFTGIVTKAGNHLTGCERYGVYPAGQEVSDRRGDEEFFFSDQLEVVEDDTEFRDDGEDGYVSHEYELGQRVEDRVTGFGGVVTVINYRLWNCPSIHIQSTSDADESLWTDVHRLQDTDGYEYVGDFKNGVEGDDTPSATGSVEDSMTRNDKA